MTARPTALDASEELAIARAVQGHTLDVLQARFGPVPADIAARLREVANRRELKNLHNLAAVCAGLDVYRAALRTGASPYLGGRVTRLVEEEGFLLALKASPDEVTALVYADWLEERGEPRPAEFLRSLVALGRAGDVPALNALTARWPQVSAGLDRDWMFRCVALLARGVTRFRILEARFQEGRPPLTLLRGALHSGRVQRGDCLLVPVQGGQTAQKYAAWLLADNRDYRTMSAGQPPLEFFLAVRGRLDAALGGVVVGSPEADTDREKLLDRRVEALGLSVRAQNVLSSEGWLTIRDVVRLTDEELLEARGFGETTWREVTLRLAEFGLNLGMAR